MSKRHSKKANKSEQRYNLWTSPPSEWVSAFAKVTVPEEIEEELKQATPPTDDEIKEKVEPFNVPLSERTLSVIVK